MCDRQKDLCLYRYNNAMDTLEAARLNKLPHQV